MTKQKKFINKQWLILIGFSLLIIAIILILWFFLHGEIKTTGTWNGTETSKSISCIANDIPYPLYGDDNPTGSQTKINIIFNGDRPTSISLVRVATYPDSETARRHSATHSFTITDNIAKAGIKDNAITTNLDYENNSAQMTLYTTGSNINNKSAKFFLLNSLPNKIGDYTKKYTEQGFLCETTE